MPQRTRAAAAQMLRRFETKVRQHEMRGALHPRDRMKVTADYLEARARMIVALMGEAE